MYASLALERRSSRGARSSPSRVGRLGFARVNLYYIYYTILYYTILHYTIPYYKYITI